MDFLQNLLPVDLLQGIRFPALKPLNALTDLTL